MPMRKVGFWGFWGLRLRFLGEERMKTPTPTRTWGGIFGGFFLVFSFLVALGTWLFACFRRWLLLLL